MPRDSHPRERQARKLARRKSIRPPYDRVLIVTEGTKTERLYFDDIRKRKRVPTAHIEVVPSAIGTQPLQVVEFACNKFLESKSFEWVFAVFDRDDHTTYSQALARAKELDNSLRNDERKLVRFLAVPTVPCFELWLLLHYEDVFAFGHRSDVINKLKARIPNYAKGLEGVFGLTEPFIDDAIRRADRLRDSFSPVGGADPYTDVDVVVEKLRSIRN